MDALKNAVERKLRELQRVPDHAIVAMAGIVTDHTRGMMTNWEEQTSLSVDMFRSWGLPETTLLVNDLEAAAYAIDAVATDGRHDCVQVLNNTTPAFFSNSVIVAPGTGLGMAVLIYNDVRKPVVLTSEAQHCPAGSFYKRHRDIITSYEEHNGEAPSWEDLVSGRGLEYLFFYTAQKEESASRIAELALSGKDQAACLAMLDYYHIAAEAAQTLALLVKPAGGVYLCGDTTVKNKELIRRSDFSKRFCFNPVHRETLSRYSLAILDIEHLVISGGIRMAQLYFR